MAVGPKAGGGCILRPGKSSFGMIGHDGCTYEISFWCPCRLGQEKGPTRPV